MALKILLNSEINTEDDYFGWSFIGLSLQKLVLRKLLAKNKSTDVHEIYVKNLCF